MLLYSATNLITGKRYIGMTTMSLADRWSAHLSRCFRGKIKTALYSAIRRYGAEAFRVEPILCLLPFCSVEDLFDLEQEVIAQEGTMCPRGYNMTRGGEGTIGYRFTPAQRAEQKRRRHGPETRAKMSAAHKGHSIPAEAIARRVESVIRSGGHRKPNLKNRGKRRTDEVRAKLSAAWTPARRARQALLMAERRKKMICNSQKKAS